MRVSIHQRRSAKELLQSVNDKYGSIRALQNHVQEHPEDLSAKLALHDVKEYRKTDSSSVIDETREIIIPDGQVDKLTAQRLHLLLALNAMSGSTPSARALARALERDIKNVSQDIRALESLGLLNVTKATRGKPCKISLPGDRIDLHLVEAKP
jgi:hypothetical protein